MQLTELVLCIISTYLLAQLNSDLTVKYVNGKTYVKENGSWVERSFGMPILDYAHPLHQFTSGNLSYTATGDCYLLGYNRDTGAGVEINGTRINDTGSNENTTIGPLKIGSGDTVVCTSAVNGLRVFTEK